jgi:ABC-type uncharacterized transport system substrate-binding protein
VWKSCRSEGRAGEITDGQGAKRARNSALGADWCGKRIVVLAAHYKLPATYSAREVALDGGLMSYGTSLTDAPRQAGIYAGRILKGDKPANLPVMQATKFELVLNLRTAKMLVLEIPATLLAQTGDLYRYHEPKVLAPANREQL